MSWDQLRAAELSVRPLSGTRPTPGRRRAQFRAELAVTVRELKRELRALEGARVVVELGIRDQDIRQDGYPRARAPEPSDPTVAISFASVHGPLRYATCEYTEWEDNLRAIVLSMQALRAVDR